MAQKKFTKNTKETNSSTAKIPPNNVVVMFNEPAKNLTPEMVENTILQIHSELELAQLYATCYNKSIWLEDEIYDYELGTHEYNQAAKASDTWLLLRNKLQNMILNILRLEGVTIPKQGIFYTLIPFMERNGYKNENGWWIKYNE